MAKKTSSGQTQKMGSHKPKKIVLFADGTGNSSSSPHKTNVWRAYKALDVSPDKNQIAFYISGVGTNGFLPLAIIGKAFGLGLAANVKTMYKFLCRSYNPGDEISCFGFSRGAFTVRVLAALIASEGIIDVKNNKNASTSPVLDDEDLDRRVNAAYRQFRKTAFSPSLLSLVGAPLRDWLIDKKDKITGTEPYDSKANLESSNSNSAVIKFLGVWDTVDAYGMPIDEMTRAWDRFVWPLSAKDRDLSKRVQHARHALALDEERQSFEPMLWNEDKEPTWSLADRPSLSSNAKTLRVDQRSILQVWFSGVHANIGGGYPDDSLAHVSLKWIMDEAQKYAGLKFLPAATQELNAKANTLGPAHDSRAGVGNAYRLDPRNLHQLCDYKKPGFIGSIKEKVVGTPQNKGEAINRVKIAKPIIHESVFHRIREDGSGYAPINIPLNYKIFYPDGKIAEAANSRAKKSFETPLEAVSREKAQRIMWNKVWYRKILYFFTLILFVLFITYPYISDNVGKVPFLHVFNGEKPHWEGLIAYAVRSIPNLISSIPGFGFASAWTDAYEGYSFPFAILLTAIIALIIWSMKIGAGARANMRQLWSHMNQSSSQLSNFSPWSHNLARFLLGERYKKIKKVTRASMEFFAIAFYFVLLVIAGMFLSRSVLFVGDLAGLYCETNESEFGKFKLDTTFEFSPKDPCFVTGINLKEDQSYVIEMQIDKTWMDSMIKADLTGWKSSPNPLVHLGTPLRRHLLLPWYQPVAKLGASKFDIYALENDEELYSKEEWKRLKESEVQYCLRKRIIPKKDAELYLYLNDAILFSPDVIKSFYANNKGKNARVKIYEANNAASAMANPICSYN